MKLLLDTHAWLWANAQPQKLNRRARRELESLKHELYLSPVSIWEAHQLARRGRLVAKPTFSDWLDRTLGQTPLREAPFNFAVAAECASITLLHSDPGDVFLAATAKLFDMTLVTADDQLLSARWLRTMKCD